MKELRRSLEGTSIPDSQSRDVLRADIRQDFSTRWGDTIRDQRGASKIAGSKYFKDLYQERYQEDPPASPEDPQHDAPPPADLESYRDALRASLKGRLYEIEHQEIENIHQKYQELQQKLQDHGKYPIKSLEDVAKAYERRYFAYDPTNFDGEFVGITFIKDAKEERTEIYCSHFNVQRRMFCFSDLKRETDQEIGPEDPPALNASDILCYHIKKNLDLVSENERKSFRLNAIQFTLVGSEKMIDASKDFILSSGKPLTLYRDTAGRGRAAFERLMTSPFGKIVSWALRDGHELLKSDTCYAVTISPQPPRRNMGPIWPYERDTGEYTGKPTVLASITYYLQ